MIEEPTPEMIERFHARNRWHVELVAANLRRMDGYAGLRRAELEDRARTHDLSKLDERERTGYVWLTWIYHCKATNTPFDVTSQIQMVIERSLDIHRRRNAHHPEAHLCPGSMSVLDLVEMVCDWTAVAQEADGVGSSHSWAEQNIGRWRFPRPSRDFVFLTIDELDRRNEPMRAAG